MKIGETYYNCDLGEVLDELARQLDINGIPLLQTRKSLQNHIMVQCPYHAGGQEKKPSAGIRKADGLFHCFACNEVHSLPEVISFCFGKQDDVLGKFGGKWLLKNFSHLEAEQRADIKLDLSRGPVRKRIEYVSEEELDKYRYTHPYLYERGMTDEIIEIFDLGYDKNTDSITFPIRDISGNTLFIARRNVKYKRYQYPKGVEKPLYGLYELAHYGETVTSDGGKFFRVPKYSEVIVCEGMFDALTCWVYGRWAVALNGLGNDLQFSQLRNLNCRKLILATDMDEPGLRARHNIRKNITNKLITEYRWSLEKYKDLNSMPKAHFLGLQDSL